MAFVQAMESSTVSSSSIQMVSFCIKLAVEHNPDYKDTQATL